MSRSSLKRFLPLIFSVVLIGTVAMALNISVERNPFAFLGGIYVGSSAPATTSNNVSKMLGARTLYNFPDLALHCRYSWPVTMTGASVGDPCFVGADVTGADNYSVGCTVTAANTAKVFACPAAGDAGVVDPADSGYYLRVISSQ